MTASYAENFAFFQFSWYFVGTNYCEFAIFVKIAKIYPCEHNFSWKLVLAKISAFSCQNLLHVESNYPDHIAKLIIIFELPILRMCYVFIIARKSGCTFFPKKTSSKHFPANTCCKGCVMILRVIYKPNEKFCMKFLPLTVRRLPHSSPIGSDHAITPILFSFSKNHAHLSRTESAFSRIYEIYETERSFHANFHGGISWPFTHTYGGGGGAL